MVFRWIPSFDLGSVEVHGILVPSKGKQHLLCVSHDGTQVGEGGLQVCVQENGIVLGVVNGR